MLKLKIDKGRLTHLMNEAKQLSSGDRNDLILRAGAAMFCAFWCRPDRDVESLHREHAEAVVFEFWDDLLASVFVAANFARLIAMKEFDQRYEPLVEINVTGATPAINADAVSGQRG